MKFVVAVDGTPGSERVLDHAAALAGAADADLVLVHAVNPSVYEVMDGPVRDGSNAEERLLLESTEDAEQRGEKLLERAAAGIEGLRVETELLYGSPATAIADYADEVGADGVFVGHRDLSEEQERMLGSVAKRLVDNSPAPVTVVR
ncbi:universal stress protein [Haloglomus litoreum]|uniref:universal stress protein n=1 Tax=Haloglomus litoreum TaxID=3034026 RepID=UPI0023E8AAB7|nr:universal stress protein [Haloglomus sp. DT116]